MPFHNSVRYAIRNQVWRDFICKLVATASSEVYPITFDYTCTNLPDDQHFLAHLPTATDAYFTNPNRHTQHEAAPGADIVSHDFYCLNVIMAIRILYTKSYVIIVMKIFIITLYYILYFLVVVLSLYYLYFHYLPQQNYYRQVKY